jgi:hypothetical protein
MFFYTRMPRGPLQDGEDKLMDLCELLKVEFTPPHRKEAMPERGRVYVDMSRQGSDALSLLEMLPRPLCPPYKRRTVQQVEVPTMQDRNTPTIPAPPPSPSKVAIAAELARESEQMRAATTRLAQLRADLESDEIPDEVA